MCGNKENTIGQRKEMHSITTEEMLIVSLTKKGRKMHCLKHSAAGGKHTITLLY